jgi:hypothetical protein
MNFIIKAGALLIGGLVLWGCIVSLKIEHDFTTTHVITEGVVVDVTIRLEKLLGSTNPGYRANIYRPTVRFTTEDGTAITVTDPKSGTTAAPAIGSRIRVVYDPHDPKNAKVGSSFQKTFWPWFFLVLDLIIVPVILFPTQVKSVLRRLFPNPLPKQGPGATN